MGGSFDTGEARDREVLIPKKWWNEINNISLFWW